jgi:hypothetical protein
MDFNRTEFGRIPFWGKQDFGRPDFGRTDFGRTDFGRTLSKLDCKMRMFLSLISCFDRLFRAKYVQIFFTLKLA